MRRVLLIAAAVALMGCGGKPTGAIVVAPAAYDAAAQTLVLLMPADVVDLTRPPQGGFVVFIGAEVKNLSDPQVSLEVRLHDPATRSVLFSDQRQIELVHDPNTSDAWKTDVTSYFDVANVTMCPPPGVDSVDSATFDLQVLIAESSTGRLGSTTIPITTACRQSDPAQLALCRCKCAPVPSAGTCNPG